MEPIEITSPERKSANRYVSVSSFKGVKYIDIREMFEKEGKLLNGKKGITLKLDELEALVEMYEKIKNAYT